MELEELLETFGVGRVAVDHWSHLNCCGLVKSVDFLWTNVAGRAAVDQWSQ